MPEGNLKNNTYKIAPFTYMINGDDDCIDINTSGGASTLYLPNIAASGLGFSRKTIYINDVSGNAGTNPITVICLGGNTVNDDPSIVLNTDGMSAEFFITDRNRYQANLSTDHTPVSISANNGLSVAIGNIVQLGGALIKPTTITASFANTLNIVDDYGTLIKSRDAGFNSELFDFGGNVNVASTHITSFLSTGNTYTNSDIVQNIGSIGVYTQAIDVYNFGDYTTIIQSAGINNFGRQNAFTNSININIFGNSNTIGSSTGITIIGSGNTVSTKDDLFIIGSNNNNLIVDAATGNVGIGTYTPITKLQVVGTGADATIVSTRYSSNANATGFAGFKARGTPSVPSAILSGDLMLTVGTFGYHSGGAFSANSVGQFVFYAKEDFTATNQGTAFKLSTTPIGSVTNVYNFGISENGDVSIGDTTLTPTARLHVKGSGIGVGTYGFRVENSAATSLFYISDTGIATVRGSSGQGELHITSVGGAEPLLSFDYEAFGGGTQGSITGSNGLKIKGNGLTTVQVGSAGVAVGESILPISDTRFYIKGVDATSANFALKVDNSASSSLLSISNDGRSIFNYGLSVLGTGFGHTFAGIAGYTNIFNVGEIGLSNSYFKIESGGAFQLGNIASTNIFNFDNTQFWFSGAANVGAGISSPTAKLHIKGIDATSLNFALKIENSTPTNLLSIANNGACVFNSILDGGGGGVDNYSYASSTGSVQVSYNSLSGSSIFNYSTGGTIGTAINEVSGFYQISSANRISLKTKADSKTHLYMSSGGQIGIGGDFFTTDASLHVQGISATSSDFALKVDNIASTALLYVRNDGNVGINQATPLYKLDVNGGVNANSYNFIQSGFASFTLEATYKLNATFIEGFRFHNTSYDFLNYTQAGNGGDTITLANSFVEIKNAGVADTTKYFGINVTATPSAMLHVQGISAISSDYALKIENSASSPSLYVRNDGLVSMPNLQVGNAGLASGDLYVDSAANIAANGDLIVGRKV